MHFTEYDTRLAAYAALVDDRDRLLVAWFNGSGPCWSMPGGGVEFDESIEDAVVREVYEETGYHVTLGPLLFTHHVVADSDERTGRPFKSQRLVFRAEVVSGTLGTVEVGGTTDRAEWIALADLEREPCAEIVRLTVAALRG